jgi:hypothetical protein
VLRSKECVELYLHSPHYFFMEWYLVKHRDRFTFTFIPVLKYHAMKTYEGMKI